MANYYEILKIPNTANEREIETAIDQQYNNWHRLVVHHDPVVVEQANQSLRVLEQIRRTLTDPISREAYNAGLGVKGEIAGLADPEIILRASLPLKVAHRVALHQETPQTTIDAWVCGKCRVSNQIGLKFCSNCGEQLGINCPSCGQLTKASGDFCTECGKNIQESIEKAKEYADVIDWINQIKLSGLRLKYIPTVRSLIAKGSFQDIYKVCFETMSSFTVRQLGLAFPIKNVTISPQNGEVNGEIGNAISWPKQYKFKLYIQKNSIPIRGVVLVITINYGAIDLGTGLSFFADPFIKLLLQRADIFTEVQQNM